ncbi:MAG TPA: hypothetical protein DCM40_20840, partial [Maribacter sp.]|nr:hypothetical protein [Maribacter sp.]
LQFFPSGSVLGGVSSSAAVHQLYIVSMSSNLDGKHTPGNASASFYTISASNLPLIVTDSGTGAQTITHNNLVNIFYTKSGSFQRDRITLAPNTNNRLTGSFFSISSSIGAHYFHFQTPETRNPATSSLIDIVGFHSGSIENVDPFY